MHGRWDPASQRFILKIVGFLIKLQIGSGSIVQKLQKGIWAAASTFLVIHPTTTIHNYSLLFYSSLLCYEMPYFQRGKFWFLVLPIHAIIILPHTASGPFGPLFIEKIWVKKSGKSGAIPITGRSFVRSSYSCIN